MIGNPHCATSELSSANSIGRNGNFVMLEPAIFSNEIRGFICATEEQTVQTTVTTGNAL